MRNIAQLAILGAFDVADRLFGECNGEAGCGSIAVAADIYPSRRSDVSAVLRDLPWR